MAFYGYQGNPYESNWTPYSSNPYDLYADFPPQSSSEYSAYEFNDPNLSGYSEYSSPSYNYSYYACTPPEHKLIQYLPQTSYSISYSYSNSEPIEPEIEVWEEYDPTPYGGGYDMVQTYGKPLTQSDETCYPRSSALDAGLLDGFSYNSLPESDVGKNQLPGSTVDEKVKKNRKKVTFAEDIGESGESAEPPSTIEENVKKGPKKVSFAEDISKSRDSAELPSSENDHEWKEQVPNIVPHSSENDQEWNSSDDQEWKRQVPNIVPYSSENDQAWNRQVPNIVPYGSGLESLDICESVFGYWPCLAKMEREKKACRACEDGERRRYDPWAVTADYLFGSPFPYDDHLQNGGNGSPFQHQNLYTESQY